MTMRTLYIVRHAKSSHKEPGLSDRERPLNDRGKTDAPLMGKWLEQHGIRPDRIRSSSAVRAYSTAERIAEEIGYPDSGIRTEDRLYATDTDRLIQAIRETSDEDESLMIIGHNPEFTELANTLGELRIDNVPTTGIVCFSFEVERWQDLNPGEGSFAFFESPKGLKG